MNRISIVYNPVAGGGGSLKKLKKLISLLEESGANINLYKTHKGDQPVSESEFEEISKTAKVIVAGGDGSLNKMVNQVYDQTGRKLTDWQFAVFPIGSGNDWARAYGFSHHPQRWVKNYLEGRHTEASLAKLEIKCQGETHKLLALNSVGVGVTGDIMKRLHQGRTKNPSKAAYLAVTLRSFYHYDYPEFRLSIDDRTIQLKMLTANLGLNLTTGGGMRLFPQNKNGKGLGLTIVNKPPLTAVPSLLWQLYFGNVSKAKNIVECLQPEEVIICSDSEQCMEIDGEMHFFTSYSAKLHPYRLKVFGFARNKQ